MKYIFMALAAASALFVGCSDNDQEIMDPAYLYKSVEWNLADNLRAKLYIDNTNTQALPLIKGEEAQLGFAVTPSADEVTFPEMAWSSSDETVATVDAQGRIKALAEGSTMITVAQAAYNSEARVSLKINVVETVVKATSISISDNHTMTSDSGLPSCYMGETMQLTATIQPENATYQSVMWSSKDEAIATIDPISGVLTGVSRGEVTIVATALDTDPVSAEHKVFIDQVINPVGLKLSNAPAADQVFSIDELSYTLEFSTYPEISTKSLITWTSSDPAIATVEGGVVKFLQFGSVTITATCPASEETPADGYATSATAKFVIPAGYYNDHFTTPTSMWNLNPNHLNSGAKQEWMQDPATGEHYWLYTPYLSGSNGRGDVMHNGSPIYLDPAYPILCFRMDYVKDREGITKCQVTLDSSGNLVSDGTKFAGSLNGNNNKWKTKYNCSDGSSLLIYDIATQKFGTGGILPSTVKFGTFQLKYADIQGWTTVEDITYRYFWFMTFKSEDEMLAYLNEWSANTGITYEKQ